MPRTIEAEGPAWEALKGRAEALAATCSGGQVDLLALAKAYAAFAVAIGEAAEAACDAHANIIRKIQCPL